MKFKHLIFALLTAASASSFTGCNESTPTPEEPINDDYHLVVCTSCENERVLDTLINQEATVVTFYEGHPQADTIYILSIQKELEGDRYIVDSDSIFLTCPPLPKEYRKAGKKVIVDISRTDCIGMLIWADSRTGFGRKAQIISIKSN
ncbi:hypothetical protein Fleli_2729 [Bernardetia litoralis DSM 6794]|uniref:Lipoprotein n=1 Tax=Bernardetia litoralis (strain ATCC 23117 / DSM 6794 / NBRC 15988 / NCIMB 1366 / Fx l1 / Sio-4) TaxID=880071 RepID=I4AM99_BERLS|nr:hypothetical protein [Bernardetia litoralis]AFM05084.1 hypothetical protein Fleli_2729 [Bernardetia litoralis DSM 6794]